MESVLIVSAQIENEILSVESGNALSEHHSMQASLLFARLLLRELLSGEGSALILGSVSREWLDPDLAGYGLREAHDYFRTHVGHWQTLYRLDEPLALFFPRIPPILRKVDLSQLMLNDSFCILTRYRGPACIDELNLSVNDHDAMVRALLEVSDSVIMAADDGRPIHASTRVKAQSEDE